MEQANIKLSLGEISDKFYSFLGYWSLAVFVWERVKLSDDRRQIFSSWNDGMRFIADISLFASKTFSVWDFSLMEQ